MMIKYLIITLVFCSSSQATGSPNNQNEEGVLLDLLNIQCGKDDCDSRDGNIIERLKVYYYKQAPYITPDSDWPGIIHNTIYLNTIKKNCKSKIKKEGLEFIEISEATMTQMLTNNTFNLTINNSLIVNLQEQNIWKFLTNNQFMSLPVYISEGMVVIVNRYRISFWFKLADGLMKIGYLFHVSAMFILVFGIFVWLAERRRNSEFDKGYRGVLTGTWMGLVTMTTLGYGDVSPRTGCGKLLATICVIMGN